MTPPARWGEGRTFPTQRTLTTGVAIMKRPTNPQLFERRREVAFLAHKGWSQAAIARHLQVPPATVSRDLAAMREFWREFPASDFEKVRIEHLQKIDLVETESWAAWQRSQEPQRAASLTRGKAGEQSRTCFKHQVGDPRYLREVSRCVAQRVKMIGVVPIEPPAPEKVERLSPIEREERDFRTFLMVRDFYGQPPYARFGELTTEQIDAIVAEHEKDTYLKRSRPVAAEPVAAEGPVDAVG
jgi:hypothetical protein